MSIELITLILFGGILGLLAIGVPLAFATGVISIGLILTNFGVDGLGLVTMRIYSTLSSFAFVAVPMFVMMGTVLEKSGVADDLFRAMSVMAGKLRGGLAIQTLVVSVILASMSGIIGGEIILLGLLALPEMLKRNYDRKLAIGTICAGGSLGTMIPPSIVLIMYGLTTETGIGELFLAVLMPGLMLAGLYMAYVFIIATLHPEKAPPASDADLNLSRKEKFNLLKNTLLPIAVAAWVLICIYSGIASINEAAGMGVIGALISALIKGTLNRGMIREVCLQTLHICGKLMWIVFGATALIGVYNLFGGSTYIAGTIEGLNWSPLMVLLMMMLVLFILGMFLDWIGILLLTMPIFVPIIVGFGYDPIWFGVLFTMNMQMSYLTPPFGPAAFYLKGVAPPDVTLSEIYSAFWPFIGLQMIAIGLLIAFPEIALWLPTLLMR
ncbi:MAG: TRAP transporter large permease [Thiolinea sp.]